MFVEKNRIYNNTKKITINNKTLGKHLFCSDIDFEIVNSFINNHILDKQNPFKYLSLYPNVYLQSSNLVKMIIISNIITGSESKKSLIIQFNKIFTQYQFSLEERDIIYLIFRNKSPVSAGYQESVKNKLLINKLVFNKFIISILDQKSIQNILKFYITLDIAKNNLLQIDSILCFLFSTLYKTIEKLENTDKTLFLNKVLKDIKLSKWDNTNFCHYYGLLFQTMYQDCKKFNLTKIYLLDLVLTKIEEDIENQKIKSYIGMYSNQHIIETIDVVAPFEHLSKTDQARISKIKNCSAILMKSSMKKIIIGDGEITKNIYKTLCEEVLLKIDKAVNNNVTLPLAILDIIFGKKIKKTHKKTHLIDYISCYGINSTNIPIKNDHLFESIYQELESDVFEKCIIYNIWDKILKNIDENKLQCFFENGFKEKISDNATMKQRYSLTREHIISYFTRIKKLTNSDSLDRFEAVDMYESMVIKLERLFIFIKSILSVGSIDGIDFKSKKVTTGVSLEDVEKVKKLLDNDFDYFFDYFYLEYFSNATNDNIRSRICHYMDDKYYNQANSSKIIYAFVTLIILVSFIENITKV